LLFLKFSSIFFKRIQTKMIIKVKVAETDLELSFDIDIETKTVHYLKVLIARDSFSLPVKEQRLEFAKNGHLRRLKNSHLINYYGLSEQNNLLTLKHQSASSSSSNSSSPYESEKEGESILF
jgi:hypothetical protein